MNKLENKYRNILSKTLIKGIERNDRTGVGSKSTFNQSLSWKVNKRFPLITGRKIYEKVFNTEFDWFLNGETNIERFKKNNIKIWNDWADENGDLGPVYGHQLRNYNSSNIDQLTNLIQGLKNAPDSRRHIISLWNPQQLKDMALPPCYLYFQFFVKNNKLNMFVVQRSGDLFLGIPYDIALFSKLLLYIAKETNFKAHKVNLQIVDAHIYNNQKEAVLEYLKTNIYKAPLFEYKNNIVNIINYKFDKKITCKVAI